MGEALPSPAGANTGLDVALQLTNLFTDALESSDGDIVGHLNGCFLEDIQKFDEISTDLAETGENLWTRSLDYLREGRAREAKQGLQGVAEFASKMFLRSSTVWGNTYLSKKAIRMIIFCELMVDTFEEKKENFTKLEMMSEKQKTILIHTIKRNANKMIDSVKKIKKGFFTGSEAHKEVTEDMADALLREISPLLFQLSLETSDNLAEGAIMATPRFVPVGIEDGIQLHVSDRSLLVWRDSFNLLIAIEETVKVVVFTDENKGVVIKTNNNEDGDKLEKYVYMPTYVSSTLYDSTFTKCIKNRNAGALHHLLKHSSAKPGDSKALLFLACQSGAAGCVRALLSSPSTAQEDINAPVYGLYGSPLKVACTNGRAGVVRVLVQEAGADPRAQVGGHTPLEAAVRGGHLPTVHLMLQLGARMDDLTTNLSTAATVGLMIHNLVTTETSVLEKVQGYQANPGTEHQEIEQFLEAVARDPGAVGHLRASTTRATSGDHHLLQAREETTSPQTPLPSTPPSTPIAPPPPPPLHSAPPSSTSSTPPPPPPPTTPRPLPSSPATSAAAGNQGLLESIRQSGGAEGAGLRPVLERRRTEEAPRGGDLMGDLRAQLQLRRTRTGSPGGALGRVRGLIPPPSDTRAGEEEETQEW